VVCIYILVCTADGFYLTAIQNASNEITRRTKPRSIQLAIKSTGCHETPPATVVILADGAAVLRF